MPDAESTNGIIYSATLSFEIIFYSLFNHKQEAYPTACCRRHSHFVLSFICHVCMQIQWVYLKLFVYVEN